MLKKKKVKNHSQQWLVMN